MSKPQLPPHETIEAEEAEEQFSISDDVDYPYAEFSDEQEIRLYRADLSVKGDLASEAGVDWNPYNVIIDGNLTVDGDVDWSDYGSGNFLLVTGDLRCRNLLLQGCPNVAIRGDLIVENGILGHHGDDGGVLKVGGKTIAKVLINTLYFNMALSEQPDAIVISDEHRIDCDVDFSDDELPEILVPELLDDDGGADEHAIGHALAAGTPILRASARPSHLAAIDALDRLLDRAESVTTLDLSEKKLRTLPEQIFRFPNLRQLSLSRNELGALPPKIGELSALEELDLSGMGLERLPPEIGKLGRLRVLDISDNALRSIPEEIGRLASLVELRAESLTCALPEALAQLTALETLDLSWLKPPRARAEEEEETGEDEEAEEEEAEEEEPTTTVAFPRVVCRLRSLKRLNLAQAVLAELPDELLQLSRLEELNLNAALGRLDHLPDLSRLPRLRVLWMDGRSGNAGRSPSHALLTNAFRLEHLEQLGIDRWGEQKEYNPKTRKHEIVRPELTALPATAFARLPKLKRLDLSFNGLTTLPESFFALKHLEEVNLEYTKLDRPTLERLQKTFPRVRLNLRHVTTRFDVDDPNWKAVHTAVKQGAEVLRSDRAQAVQHFERALSKCTPGACYSDYDEIYALYGLVDALGNLATAASGGERAGVVTKLETYAEKALSLVPQPGMIWHFTDEGAFQEEVTRRAGNALAWHLMEKGQLDRALQVIERALAFAAEPQFDWVRDTQVRILLKMGRTHDAYLVVDRVLTRDPTFADFQDLKASPEFQAWREANGARLLH